MAVAQHTARQGDLHGHVSSSPRRLDVVAPPTAGARRWLRWVLVGSDAVTVAIAWCVALLLLPTPGSGSLGVLAVLGGVVAALAAAASQGLYLSRVAAVRSEELSRSGRAALASAGGAWAVLALAESPPSIQRLALGAGAAFVLLATARSVYGTWLRLARARGRFRRPVVVIGTNSEAAELCRLLLTHPEVGFEAVAAVGTTPPDDVVWPRVPVVGRPEQIEQVLRKTGANGVIIAAGALDADRLNDLTRRLVSSGVHVHLSNGLRGIAAHRLRSLPLAYEPLFYLEPIELSPWQTAVKRAIDVTLSFVVLALSLPVLLVAAAAIRVFNGKPVLFRQQRVGRDGRPFEIVKFRTMKPDAEHDLVEVSARNERAGGPLFKITNDPRRTRLGAVLEALSIDELPQLWNVLRNEMSLVGPRPALPDEVAQFDDELLERLRVPPGVTGLWQVEARDNPEFHAYRRLDLFYVENWSVTFDLSILVSTVRMLIVRAFTSFVDRAVASTRGDEDALMRPMPQPDTTTNTDAAENADGPVDLGDGFGSQSPVPALMAGVAVPKLQS